MTLTLNLVVGAYEVDNVAGCISEDADSAAVYERSQRLIDVDLATWDGKHHVNTLLGDLLRQLADRRVVLQSTNP